MDGEVVISTKLDTKSFDRQIDEIEGKLQEIDEMLAHPKEYNLTGTDFEKLNVEAEKLNNKLIQLRNRQDEINNQGMKNIIGSVNNVGNSIEGIIRKTGKWILAIFSIRSAYSAVRGAVSTLSQYDEQMKVNIEWIRYLLASTLKPVIESIINLVYKLLVYVGYIAKAWFGVNLFANASKKAFEKAHSSAKKTNKELQKTIAGFDEMNVLSDNKNKSGNDGGISSANFPKMEDVPIPEWVKWIADNKDKVLDFFKTLGILIGAIKIGEFLSKLGGIGEFIGKNAGPIAGILIALWGIGIAIDGIIKFINDPSFENFIQILEGIAIAVLGIAIAVGAWPVAIGAAIALIIVEIVKHFDKIMGFFEELIKWLDTNVLGGLRKLFGPLGDIIYLPIKFAVEFGVRLFETFYGGIKKVVEGIVMIFKGDFLGGIKKIFGGLLNILTAPLQGFLKAVKNIIPNILNLFKQIGTKVGEVLGNAFKTVINGVLKAIESILNTPIKAVNGLIGVINKVPGINLDKLSTFNLPRLAKGGIVNLPGKGVPVGGALTGEVNREGVIPLTDSQQMELLGEAIGRYITVNLTNVTELDGRTIARKVAEVNNNTNFLLNR